MNDRRPYTSGLLDDSAGAGSVMIRPRVSAEGREVWLEEVLGPDFALLRRNAADGPGLRWFEHDFGGRCLTLGEQLDDPDGQLEAWLKRRRVSCVLVRPDRYVFGTDTDPEALCQRLAARIRVDN